MRSENASMCRGSRRRNTRSFDCGNRFTSESVPCTQDDRVRGAHGGRVPHSFECTIVEERPPSTPLRASFQGRVVTPTFALSS
jgi:hypothetical protein